MGESETKRSIGWGAMASIVVAFVAMLLYAETGHDGRGTALGASLFGFCLACGPTRGAAQRTSPKATWLTATATSWSAIGVSCAIGK